METEQAPKTSAEQQPLLEINTLAPVRPFITIDDVRYDFRVYREMGAIEYQEFTRDVNRYDELWLKGLGGEDADEASKRRTRTALTSAERNEQEALLETLWPQTLTKPDELREQLGDRLTGVLKREILVTFSDAPLLMELAARDNQTAPEAEAVSSTIES